MGFLVAERVVRLLRVVFSGGLPLFDPYVPFPDGIFMSSFLVYSSARNAVSNSE